MDQVSAELHNDAPRTDDLPVRGSLLVEVVDSFDGLPPQPRRRRPAVTGNPDPETNSDIPLGHVNGTEPSSLQVEGDEAIPHAPAQPPLIIYLTVNRLCRIITIIALGFWGGWSLMPAEKKVPVSATWVAYICITTDWIVLATDLDCIRPATMDWYFRKYPQWRLLVKENTPPQVRVTGYRILCSSLLLGYPIFKYVLQSNQPLLNRTDLLIGGFIAFCLYWLAYMDGKPESPCPWFFYNDYGPAISSVARTMFALWSWWWIAFRILAIVNILRNRGKPELAVQFLTLTVGLAIEGILLGWFFLIPVLPHLFKWAHWDRGLWYYHRTVLLAMLASWVLVVVFGLWKDLPNIVFPCSGSTSMICRALIAYAY